MSTLSKFNNLTKVTKSKEKLMQRMEKSKTIHVDVTPAPAPPAPLAQSIAKKYADAELNFKSNSLPKRVKKLIDQECQYDLNAKDNTNILNSKYNTFSEESKYEMKNEQTPISITNKSKTSSIERLIDNELNKNEPDPTKQRRNSKSDLNQILTTQSTSYYNDIKNKEIEHENPKFEQKFVKQTSSQKVIVIKDEEMNQGEAAAGVSAGDSYMDELNPFRTSSSAMNNLVSEAQRVMDTHNHINIEDMDEPINSADAVLTFYNGNKVWTASTFNPDTNK